MGSPAPLASLVLGYHLVECFTYQPDWRDAFRALNQAWLEDTFGMEPQDEAVLSDPEGTIIEQGGEVFFIRLSGDVVGTCALLPWEDGSLEVAKLAVDPRCQGLGIGRLLVDLCLVAARLRGVPSLKARTNPALKASYRLFTTSGFQDVGPDPTGDYARETILLEKGLGARH